MVDRKKETKTPAVRSRSTSASICRRVTRAGNRARGSCTNHRKPQPRIVCDLNKPIGVAGWEAQIVEKLPECLKGSLPTVEEIEAKLSREEIER